MQEFNIVQLLAKLWQARRLYCIVLAVCAVLGVVVAFSIPKVYKTEVMLAPEVNASDGASLSSIASMVGVNLGSGALGDAIYPEYYPDIISSTPFLVSLFDVPVQTIDGELKTTLTDYITKHQKGAWWSAAFLPIKKLMKQLSKKPGPKGSEDGKINPFMLSYDETMIAGAIDGMILCSVDKTTQMITLSVEAQDPLVSAQLADTVSLRLQSFITDYRTNKARNDMKYMEKLCLEARGDYAHAQRLYTDFAECHYDVTSPTAKAKLLNLENEMGLAYNVYTQMEQQLQAAKAKVQEKTPVYAVIQPATVPIKADSPKKILLLFLYLFLGFMGTTLWVLVGDKLKQMHRSFKQIPSSASGASNKAIAGSAPSVDVDDSTSSPLK